MSEGVVISWGDHRQLSVNVKYLRVYSWVTPCKAVPCTHESGRICRAFEGIHRPVRFIGPQKLLSKCASTNIGCFALDAASLVNDVVGKDLNPVYPNPTMYWHIPPQLSTVQFY